MTLHYNRDNLFEFKLSKEVQKLQTSRYALAMFYFARFRFTTGRPGLPTECGPVLRGSSSGWSRRAGPAAISGTWTGVLFGFIFADSKEVEVHCSIKNLHYCYITLFLHYIVGATGPEKNLNFV